MRHIPTTETKNMELYLGSRYHFYTGTGAKAFNVLAKNADNSASITKVEGSIDSFAVDTATEGNNKFIEFEISVDTVAKSTAMKINGVETYKDVPQYVDSKQGPTSFDELKIRYNTATGTTDIDDIKVIVTDPAVCSSENWAEKTGIDFEDFGVGLIRASETENVGGFTNTHTEDNDFYSFINYSYDSESPQTIDKYLTITKNSTGNGGRSVKRDISAVTSNYSVYDLSFKIKNDLTGSTSTAIIKDGDGSKTAGGTAVGFTTTGTAFYFDYSQENAKVSLDQQLFAPGEWTPVKFRVYKNEDRADIYIGDMTTPVAEGVTTNYKFGGRSFVSAPQNSTMGSISVNDIAITGVEDDDYVFTYVAGSTDMSKFTSGRITAECKTAASVAKTPIVVVAEYNANGELDRIDVSGEIGEDGTVKAELSGVTAAEGKSVRLMLWDGYDSLKPLRKSVTLLPEITAAD
ncbi:MAG: hypothetical protein Q4E94_03440 [Clostridia bacterium]|nr:hypothetical protein [Clostridia bacterium]